jgi:hypothetical protein
MAHILFPPGPRPFQSLCLLSLVSLETHDAREFHPIQHFVDSQPRPFDQGVEERQVGQNLFPPRAAAP